ncbi:MAG: hypothetical protein JXA03_03780 [Bacteroidales bacterium]|nr:hypothetical protein [Bacteroidales bacterium]
MEQISALLKKLESTADEVRNKEGVFHEIDKDIAREDIRILYVLFDELYQAQHAPGEQAPLMPDQPEKMKDAKLFSAGREKEKPKKEPKAVPPVPEFNLFSAEKPQEKGDPQDKSAQINENRGQMITTETRKPGLKKAIGINDKFFFINELFDGNLKDYNSLIENLDNQNTTTEAFEMLEKKFTEKGWERHPDAFARLKQYVERNIH